MKIMFLSCVHGLDSQRADIYEMFLRRMFHIYEKYEIETLVVGSERAWDFMDEDSGFHYRDHANRPVSDKWNHGLSEIREFEPTHVIEIGSDDLISDSLVERYIEILNEKDYGVIGIEDSYYISLKPTNKFFNQCYYWPGYPEPSIIGYARVYSSRVLDAVNWQLWPPGINSRLNFSANRTILDSRIVYEEKRISIKEEGHLCVDIKTHGNISSMCPIARDGQKVNFEALIRRTLPGDEANHIITYRNNISHEV